MVKKTQGKRKIEMKFRGDPSSRSVTFTKRRSGLFKKACELSTLCGVDIGIIVFSIAGFVYTFGSPNFSSVVNRFLNDEPNGEPRHDNNLEVEELHNRLDELTKHLESGKLHKEELKISLLNGGFETTMCQLDIFGLEEMKRSLEETKKKVAERMHMLSLESCPVHDDDASTIPSDWLRL